jgi:hypothetical protein
MFLMLWIILHLCHLEKCNSTWSTDIFAVHKEVAIKNLMMKLKITLNYGIMYFQFYLSYNNLVLYSSS